MEKIIDSQRTTPVQPIRLGYRPRELARLTGIAPATVYLWISKGELKAVRKGRAIIVPAEEVDRLLGSSAD